MIKGSAWLIATSLCPNVEALYSTIEAVGSPQQLRCEVRGTVTDDVERLLLAEAELGAQPHALDIRWTGADDRLVGLRVSCRYAADPQSLPTRYTRTIGVDDPFWKAAHGTRVYPQLGRPVKLRIELMRIDGALLPALSGSTCQPLLPGCLQVGGQADYTYVLPLEPEVPDAN